MVLTISNLSMVGHLIFIRALFIHVANQGWPLSYMDVNNACLYNGLHEIVYIEQWFSSVARWKNQDMICRLKKAIYGSKQSSRAWFYKLNWVIGDFGFYRCCFLESTIIIYVDDILISWSDFEVIKTQRCTCNETLTSNTWDNQDIFKYHNSSKKIWNISVCSQFTQWKLFTWH